MDQIREFVNTFSINLLQCTYFLVGLNNASTAFVGCPDPFDKPFALGARSHNDTITPFVNSPTLTFLRKTAVRNIHLENALMLCIRESGHQVKALVSCTWRKGRYLILIC